MIYPPRPETAMPSSKLHLMEEQGYHAEVKLNGSHFVYLGQGEVFNRHGERVNWDIAIPYDGCFCGEYMNKGSLHNGYKVVIFDLLQWRGKTMVGKTRKERIDTLLALTQYDDGYVHNLTQNVAVIKQFTEDFDDLYKSVIKHKELEGLVCKLPYSTLKPTYNSSMNSKWQFKFRKPSKVYAL